MRDRVLGSRSFWYSRRLDSGGKEIGFWELEVGDVRDYEPQT